MFTGFNSFPFSGSITVCKGLCQVLALSMIIGGCASKTTPSLGEAPQSRQEASPSNNPEAASAEQKLPEIGVPQQELERRKGPTLESFLTPELTSPSPEMLERLELRGYSGGLTTLENRWEVTADLFNTHPIQGVRFQVRSLFFREDGTLTDYTPWIEVVIRPRQTHHYRAISGSVVARKELLQIAEFEVVQPEELRNP
ncbi:MAG: hypothetical protein SFY68_11080 [Candidatus Sumerlaeia bacterium]|nr:hypothetical protein [Candidatus Sumerlaeia bacterium]